MTRVAPSGDHPAVELAGGERPRRRPRVEAVGLRPRLADAGIGGADDDDPGDVRRRDPFDLPRRPAHLERNPIPLAQAPREQRAPVRAPVGPP
jgi:hypothetical protein